MKIFIMDDLKLMQGAGVRPEIHTIIKCILENNTKVIVENDNEYGFNIRCENKLRDMLIYGLSWIEIKN